MVDRALTDRLRACCQHCALKWVMSERMTNQSLRERFQLPENKSATISHMITVAVEEKKIKPDERSKESRKYARYVPIWA